MSRDVLMRGKVIRENVIGAGQSLYQKIKTRYIVLHPVQRVITMSNSGYEWICPTCKKYNTEIEISEVVECEQCKAWFITNPAEHAYG